MRGRPSRQPLPFQQVAALLVGFDEMDPQQLPRELEEDVIHDLGNIVDLPGRHPPDIQGKDRQGFLMLLLQGRQLQVPHGRVILVEPALDHDVRRHPRDLKDHRLIPEGDETAQGVEAMDQREPLDISADFFPVSCHGFLVCHSDAPHLPWRPENPDQAGTLVCDNVVDQRVVLVPVEKGVSSRKLPRHP